MILRRSCAGYGAIEGAQAGERLADTRQLHPQPLAERAGEQLTEGSGPGFACW